MLDFTSALYLGLHHPGSSLRPWARLTTGRPALLGELPAAGETAAKLAALIGCERAVMVPSTLHLFWDLFMTLGEKRMAVFVDASVYPIPRWGTERAAAKGTPVHRFRHHDPEALLSSVRRRTAGAFRPVVVTDGFCPACGKLAPLPDYLAIARRYDGLLVIDDTQALGVLGRSPSVERPYGEGGGGALRYYGMEGPDILAGSSLAKGFGVPVAVLAGSSVRVARFERESDTRTHCSPASAALLHAAWHALDVNESHGEVLRLRLARLVAGFCARARQNGLITRGGLFPVQLVAPGGGIDCAELHLGLLRSGVRSVLVRGHGENALGFMITANHRSEEIGQAMERLAAHIGGPCSSPNALRHLKETPYEHTLRICPRAPSQCLPLRLSRGCGSA